MAADALAETVDDLHAMPGLARARGEIGHAERRLHLRQPLRVGERRRRMYERDLQTTPPGGRLYGRSGGCYLPLPKIGCQRSRSSSPAPRVSSAARSPAASSRPDTTWWPSPA